ncbi:MAG: hypothetical protein KJ587_18435 [Alphaproteobacteria bacterium]|nr:hypothetical protein [Alphaproteobacteria bacterium]
MEGRSVLADAVVGPHSVLTSWVFDVVERLSNVAKERPIIRIDRFDAVEFFADPRPVYLTNYPGNRLIQAIADGDVRSTVVLEDPLDVGGYLSRALGIDAMETIRSQSASAVANLEIGRSEQVYFLDRMTEKPVGRIVVELDRHLDFKTSPDRLAAVTEVSSRGLGAEAKLEDVLAKSDIHYAPLLRRYGNAQVSELQLASLQVLEPLLAMARGDTFRPVVWPNIVFKFGDDPAKAPPLEAEIGGPSRVLFFGPYLYLPPARYRAESVLYFSEEITEVPFVVEFHCGTLLAKARIEKQRAGAYRGYCLIDHRDATSTVEVRIRNEQGVKHGRLSLIELLFFVEADIETGREFG